MLIFGVITILALIVIKLWFRTINWMEFLFMWIGAGAVAGLFAVLIAMDFDTMDVEVWNGEITAKHAFKRDCQRGWQSSTDDFCTEYRTRTVVIGQSCTTDSKGVSSCTPITDTEYNYDYDWERRYFLVSNVKAEWEIPRIDAQGVKEPPFYQRVSVGDPASATHAYRNWILGVKDSIFHEAKLTEEKYEAIIPSYPIKLYDLFSLNRVLAVGVELPNQAEYNKQLAIALKTLGPQKQMNAIILVVNADEASGDYAYAVRRAWSGFKKNDAVVFIGVRNGTVVWSDVLSWTKNYQFNVALRNSINIGSTLDLRATIDSLTTYGHQFYERRSMDEFEFLRDQAETPSWIIWLCSILQLFCIAGTTYFFHREEF